MAALSDVFLTPLGLLALAAVVPLVVLYLIRPEPERYELPTLRFLTEQERQAATSPLFETLKRSLLLLLQIAVIAFFAASLASPYVSVSEATTVEETVMVVDTSASMATETGMGGSTRFDRAVADAREAATSTNSLVVSGGGGVVLRGGTRADLEAALDSLRVAHTEGDLRSAVASAAAVAGENARIVVFSDFADGTNWRESVETARARGLRVELRQFNAGGAGNVGVIDQSFAGNEVTVSVKNFGESTATRTVRFADASRRLTLEAGDVATATFEVPAGGAPLRLQPGDSFPVDDTVYVAAPPDATIDVLLVTNDRNRFLSTALSVVDEVSLTVETPPTTVDGEYDVIVFSNVDGDRLLQGTVESARDLVANGGGVAIQAQEGLPGKYGDLLLLEAGDLRTNPTVGTVADDRLTTGITFSAPEEYVSGSLRSGRALVELTDGTPLLAVEERDGGRVLYYGYIEERSNFKFNYQYPVFWKRTVFYLAGRDPLPSLNRETGDRLQFDGETTVETPEGTVTATVVPLDRTGFYAVGDRRVSASLLSESESDVVAADLETTGQGGIRTREEERRVPRPLTEWTALAALIVGLGELGYLRYRGDL